MPEPRAQTVLVVDDDQGLTRLIEKTLRREGCTTAAAGSAAAAEAWLASRPADLMLLDLQLGDIHASAFIERLVALGRLLPFIIITGQGDERVAVEMMKRGALDYLVKDANFLEFLPARVRRSLERLDSDHRLAAAEAERARLEQQILEISERERRRIGQDLHDGLGQHLAGLELMVDSLEQKLAAQGRPEAARAADIARHVREAIRQSRALARGLSPVELDANGLMCALQELAANISALFRVRCRFHCPIPVPVADNTAATHLFRIVQEAVSNAVKHGRATGIDITLAAARPGLRLEIADNGTGLPPEETRGQGMGLRIMRYRVATLGGNVTVAPGPEGGTVVACTAPLLS
jgi:signal transduction histidine kinase